MRHWYRPRKRAQGTVKIIDPTPVWEVTIKREGRPETKIYVQTEKAEEYMQAGFPVKMVTKAGALKQA